MRSLPKQFPFKIVVLFWTIPLSQYSYFFFIFEFFGSLGTKTLLLRKFCFWYGNTILFYILSFDVRFQENSKNDVWGYYSGRRFCHVFCRLCQCLCWPRWHWCQHWASHLFSWSIKLASQFFLHKVPKVGHVLSGLVLIQLKLTLNRCKSKKWKFFQMIELTRNRKKSKTIR